MPKHKKLSSTRLHNFVEIFGSDIFETNGEVLFCKICSKSVSADRKGQIEQHVATGLHRKGLARQETKKQSLFTKSWARTATSEASEILSPRDTFVKTCALILFQQTYLYSNFKMQTKLH